MNRVDMAERPAATEAAALRNLRTIPGVGKAVSRDLLRLGVRSVRDLRSRDPEELYERLCEIQRARVDPCMLYTFRCAVYYASTEDPDPELLKWWNWKDRTPALRD